MDNSNSLELQTTGYCKADTGDSDEHWSKIKDSPLVHDFRYSSLVTSQSDPGPGDGSLSHLVYHMINCAVSSP